MYILETSENLIVSEFYHVIWLMHWMTSKSVSQLGINIVESSKSGAHPLKRQQICGTGCTRVYDTSHLFQFAQLEEAATCHFNCISCFWLIREDAEALWAASQLEQKDTVCHINSLAEKKKKMLTTVTESTGPLKQNVLILSPELISFDFQMCPSEHIY